MTSDEVTTHCMCLPNFLRNIELLPPLILLLAFILFSLSCLRSANLPSHFSGELSAQCLVTTSGCGSVLVVSTTLSSSDLGDSSTADVGNQGGAPSRPMSPQQEQLLQQLLLPSCQRFGRSNDEKVTLLLRGLCASVSAQPVPGACQHQLCLQGWPREACPSLLFHFRISIHVVVLSRLTSPVLFHDRPPP
jgi:hypothetical protein